MDWVAGRRLRTAIAFATCSALVLPGATGAEATPLLRHTGCNFWVAPRGDDAASGSDEAPWATIEHAAEAIPDRGCTVWVRPGRYEGRTKISRAFDTPARFRAIPAYGAELVADETVLDIDGARNVTISGFDIHHGAADTEGYVVIVDRNSGRDRWAEDITLANNVIHDSHGDDLLKIHNGVRRATVVGNLFFNQADHEQHIDVNSATDVAITDNIFFNDLPDGEDRKAFIVVKDSGGDADGLVGSRRVTIARNVFLNHQGEEETFVQIGNDGKPYYEADRVTLENNLFLGNSEDHVYSTIGIRGARRVQFVNNTVVGDLPGPSYGFWASTTGDNPINERLDFVNNIWSDPTGTMGTFSRGQPVDDLVLDNNLYWNGGRAVPEGRVVGPSDDDARIVADPGLRRDQRRIMLPNFADGSFGSGATSIRQEFVRLVTTFGAIPEGSPAIDRADSDRAPSVDILRRPRGSSPDLGAFEYSPG